MIARYTHLADDEIIDAGAQISLLAQRNENLEQEVDYLKGMVEALQNKHKEE